MSDGVALAVVKVELEKWKTRALAAEKERDEARATLSELMGKGHVLKAVFSTIRRWGDDPVFLDPAQYESQRAAVRAGSLARVDRYFAVPSLRRA